jgi:phage portal protein BeeE
MGFCTLEYCQASIYSTSFEGSTDQATLRRAFAREVENICTALLFILLIRSGDFVGISPLYSQGFATGFDRMHVRLEESG